MITYMDRAANGSAKKAIMADLNHARERTGGFSPVNLGFANAALYTFEGLGTPPYHDETLGSNGSYPSR